MGWGLDFKLIELNGILAKYQCGQCLHELDGILMRSYRTEVFFKN